MPWPKLAQIWLRRPKSFSSLFGTVYNLIVSQSQVRIIEKQEQFRTEMEFDRDSQSGSFTCFFTHHCFPKFTTVIQIRLTDRLFSWMILEWVFCFIYTCTENVRSIFDDIRRLDRYEMLRCGTVQIVPNCLPDVYFIIYLMFTLSSHYITLPRSYSIIEHVTWSHLMSCDDHVTHREDLSYSNNVLGDRWTNET